MDYPKYIDTSMELSILCFKGGCQSKFLLNDAFLSLKIVFSLANSADPDELNPYAAFYLGLQCLPKYLFVNEKG